MPQSKFIELGGSRKSGGPDPEQAIGDDLGPSRRACVPAWRMTLLAALAIGLLMLAIGPPGAAWRLDADFANAGGKRETGMRPTERICATLPISVAAISMSASGLFHRRALRYQKVELQLSERRHAHLKRGLLDAKVRRRRHRVLDSFFQYQRWLATLYIGGAGDGTAPSTLTSDNLSEDVIEGPNGTLIGDVTFPVASNGSFSSAAGGSATKDETGALEVSGGSIADISKVTVDASGGLELFFTSNWSFTAKFDGEIRPQPKLYAGSGTLNYAW